MPRYRAGVDRVTGKPLTGYAHMEQCVAFIVQSMKGDVVMLYDLGADIDREIGRGMHRPMLLSLFARLIASIHAWELEFRVRKIALVNMTRVGGLAVAIDGLYYPEGRYGNYKLSEPATLNIPLIAANLRGAA
ncbi:MAG: integrase [Rhodoblastus sp.]